MSIRGNLGSKMGFIKSCAVNELGYTVYVGNCKITLARFYSFDAPCDGVDLLKNVNVFFVVPLCMKMELIPLIINGKYPTYLMLRKVFP